MISFIVLAAHLPLPSPYAHLSQLFLAIVAYIPFIRLLTNSRRQSRGILTPHDASFLLRSVPTRVLLPILPVASSPQTFSDTLC